MDELKLRDEIDRLKQKATRELKVLNSSVEMLSCRDESPGATTLDVILLLLLKAEIIDDRGERITERSYRRKF